MTSEQFRASPERVAAMRDLLNNSIFADAIVCLQDSRPPTSVAPGSDGMESARALARIEQHEADVDLLLSLATPITSAAPAEEPATWGVDKERLKELFQPPA